jgi:hypothetical protein
MIQLLSLISPTNSYRHGRRNSLLVISFYCTLTNGFLFSGSCPTTEGGSTMLAFAARFGLVFVSTIYGHASGSSSVSTTVSFFSIAFGLGTLLALAFGLGGGSGSLTSSVLNALTSSFSVFSFSLIVSVISA